jgi:hypothetical protein
MPDMDIPTSITAGHLQNSGYNLLHAMDNKFLYFYTGQDVYMSCSWENSTCPNPLVKHIVQSVTKSIKSSEVAATGHGRSLPQTLASIGEAADEASDASSAIRS